VLKKTGIAVAVAAAGLLAASGLAFADDVDQKHHQHSTQDNGVDEGNQLLHGNADDPHTVICDVNAQLGAPDHTTAESIHPTVGSCDNAGESAGSTTEQSAKNSDDKGGDYTTSELPDPHDEHEMPDPHDEHEMPDLHEPDLHEMPDLH
jgi:hypothetical protein